MSLLRHLIIENGPYAPGHTDVFGDLDVTADELNELRMEILGLLVWRSITQSDRFRLEVSAYRDGDGACVELMCTRCDTVAHSWDVDNTGGHGGGEAPTLAELNQRADEHTEVCR